VLHSGAEVELELLVVSQVALLLHPTPRVKGQGIRTLGKAVQVR
jgi:hypothetical protein